jgi:Tfp pilus assembly protein PilF
MMKRCPRCGTGANEEDAYCGSCGYHLLVEGSTPGVTQKELKADDIRLNLGMVYYKMGKYAQAVEVFEKILQHDPDNLQVLDWCERARQQQHSAMTSP